jgi:hypothetical protein
LIINIKIVIFYFIITMLKEEEEEEEVQIIIDEIDEGVIDLKGAVSCLVQIAGARKLFRTERITKQNPYCKIWASNSIDKVEKTLTIKNGDKECIWKETFPIAISDYENEIIYIEVLAERRFSSHVLIGTLKLYVNSIRPQVPNKKWYSLIGKDGSVAGEIFLESFIEVATSQYKSPGDNTVSKLSLKTATQVLVAQSKLMYHPSNISKNNSDDDLKTTYISPHTSLQSPVISVTFPDISATSIDSNSQNNEESVNNDNIKDKTILISTPTPAHVITHPAPPVDKQPPSVITHPAPPVDKQPPLMNWVKIDQVNKPSYYWNKSTNQITYEIPLKLQDNTVSPAPSPVVSAIYAFPTASHQSLVVPQQSNQQPHAVLQQSNQQSFQSSYQQSFQSSYQLGAIPIQQTHCYNNQTEAVQYPVGGGCIKSPPVVSAVTPIVQYPVGRGSTFSTTTHQSLVVPQQSNQQPHAVPQKFNQQPNSFPQQSFQSLYQQESIPKQPIHSHNDLSGTVQYANSPSSIPHQPYQQGGVIPMQQQQGGAVNPTNYQNQGSVYYGGNHQQPNVQQNITLPQGWQQLITGDGKVYYSNSITKTTSWERPR